MKILITGGTGFVGRFLTEKLLERGDEIVLVSSKGSQQENSNERITVLKADTTVPGSWQDGLAEYDVIVNVTGRTIFNLWSEAYKKEIYTSRVNTTQNIVDGLPDNSDVVLLNASAAGYYGDCGDKELTEDAPVGTDFLATVCKDWEKAAFAAERKGARVAIMRFGVILGKGGGAISTMKTPFKLGVGGAIGSGKQWFPWIHLDDLIGAILFLMDGSGLSGAYNFTAPGSVRQREFAKTLGRVLNRPTFMPTPAFVMKSLLGEFGKSLLMGQKATPKALLESGFSFRYPSLELALQEILNG